jgi:hypothetical protein
MRFIYIILFVILAGCAAPIGSEPFKPAGHLLFSVRLVNGAFTGVEERLTGIFFYIGEPEPYVEGPMITGYVVRKGAVTETISAGSYESISLRKHIEEIDFVPFDIESEIKTIDLGRREEANRTGTMVSQIATLDGAEYELHFVFGEVDYSLRRWNPGAEIDFYATYSPKIRKLKELLDTFACYYGRRKFDI